MVSKGLIVLAVVTAASVVAAAVAFNQRAAETAAGAGGMIQINHRARRNGYDDVGNG